MLINELIASWSNKSSNKSLRKSELLSSIELSRHLAFVCDELGFEYNVSDLQSIMFWLYGFYLYRKRRRLVNEKPRALSFSIFRKAADHFDKNFFAEKSYAKKYEEVDGKLDDVFYIKFIERRYHPEFGFSNTLLYRHTTDNNSPLVVQQEISERSTRSGYWGDYISLEMSDHAIYDYIGDFIKNSNAIKINGEN